MNLKRCVAAAVVGGVAWAGGVSALQPEMPKVPDMPEMPEAPEMSPEDMAEMQAWIEAATPGPHHAHLGAMIGSWKAVNTYWMEPGGEATVSHATEHAKWVLDGRFVRTDYKGDVMGQPFSGFAHVGYDNVKKEYVSTWMDTFGTGVMIDKGQCNDSGSVITMYGSYADPSRGEQHTKSVHTFTDADHRELKMFTKQEDGSWFKHMHIKYTRVAGGTGVGRGH